MAAGLMLTLFGTGCATKKYVAKTVSPIEGRVTGTEGKNTEQDKAIADHGTQIDSLGNELSRTKERLTDTDTKATRAGEAAQQANNAAKAADQKAGTAQQSADGAKQAADNVKTFAEGIDRRVQTMNKFTMAKNESVLFGFDKDVLSDDAKQQLTALGEQAKGMERYVIEIEGFTDKTGSATYNEALSQRRAQAVARFLANQFNIPVRNITVLGVGYSRPVSDEKTFNSRKADRRVEVRLWVPEGETQKTSTSAGE